MGKDGQAEARRFHGETQQDTGGAGYLFRTPGEMGEGVWSLDVVGLFKPQKHEKHKKVRATSVDALSSVSRFSRRCQVQVPFFLTLPPCGSVWPYAAGLSLASLWNDATQALWEAMHSPAVLGAEGATAERLLKACHNGFDPFLAVNASLPNVGFQVCKHSEWFCHFLPTPPNVLLDIDGN